MRIASYNIRKAIGLDWRRDADRIVRVLHEIDADVVVLQEADKRIGQRAGVLPLAQMEEELGYVFADVSIRPESHGWHGNAILYRKKTMMLDRAERVKLPTLEPRGAISARFAVPGIEIVGVHLALSRGIRIRQIRAIESYLEHSDHPTLVAGDFNIWKRDTDITETLRGGFEMITPGNSYHASRPVTALDRFVLKGAARHMSSHVHSSDLAARASDHLPIVIDLDLEKDSA
ncbi:endonuclease/exonuclease/phosphatase family protein [Sulfitobacter sp. MF3-043]|uniref:endonuclease/exonuclease/phosphatase family protein n=1 Tax=Sulfitobacter sediminivivens TaxID=3252902 RepID=UPI0036DB0329